MQHEVYPEDKEQSSRFVLLVREIELVDRLAASQLNKFLSQYVSNTMPKQTHANMVRMSHVYTCDCSSKKIAYVANFDFC